MNLMNGVRSEELSIEQQQLYFKVLNTFLAHRKGVPSSGNISPSSSCVHEISVEIQGKKILRILASFSGRCQLELKLFTFVHRSIIIAENSVCEIEMCRNSNSIEMEEFKAAVVMLSTFENSLIHQKLKFSYLRRLGYDARQIVESREFHESTRRCNWVWRVGESRPLAGRKSSTLKVESRWRGNSDDGNFRNLLSKT